MSDTKYKKWLEIMKDIPKEDILKDYYKLIFKYEKQKEVLDKANEYLNKVRMFAMVDKINILSISTLENILKGSDNNE